MAYPVSNSPFGSGAATPNPAYSGVFIPEIWSGKLIEKFYDTTVLAAISNTDYEGELKSQGDKIKIRTRPTITIRDYQSDQTLTVDRPSSNLIEMLIDKGKYFNLALDDVMEIQSDINLMSEWSTDAAEQMKIKIDTDVLLNLLGTPAAANRGTTAGRITGAVNLGATTAPIQLVSRNPAVGKVEVVDLIVRMGQILDEQNIPQDGRWMVIPSWIGSLIKQSELRDASLTGDGTTMLRNGRLGVIDRFTLYVSNLLPKGAITGLALGEWVVYAGHKNGLSFASQFTKTETMRSELSFASILRGLQIYGYKVIDPTAITQAVVTPG
jgi:hypothetical protein